jgi:hypothetical protein
LVVNGIQNGCSLVVNCHSALFHLQPNCNSSLLLLPLFLCEHITYKLPILQPPLLPQPQPLWMQYFMLYTITASRNYNTSYLPNITVLVFGKWNHSFIHKPSWLSSVLASINIKPWSIYRNTTKWC